MAYVTSYNTSPIMSAGNVLWAKTDWTLADVTPLGTYYVGQDFQLSTSDQTAPPFPLHPYAQVQLIANFAVFTGIGASLTVGLMLYEEPKGQVSFTTLMIGNALNLNGQSGWLQTNTGSNLLTTNGNYSQLRPAWGRVVITSAGTTFTALGALNRVALLGIR